MGVRCVLLGHVHDSTEFEERREGRPSGTVLICREYQVCRRCGDREEMYRNEQVLASGTPEADPLPRRTTTEPDSPENKTETQQADERGGDEPVRATADERGGDESDRQQDGSADDPADADGSTAPEHWGEVTPDAATDQITDDAVIISDPTTNGDSRPATDAGRAGRCLTTPSTDGVRLGCEHCGQEWRRDATSLRDGDLCPECRRAYVEGS